MNLPDYIRKVGPDKFAAQFGITKRAAISYQYRARLPRATLAQKIVDKSPVTWEGIYGKAEKAAN